MLFEVVQKLLYVSVANHAFALEREGFLFGAGIADNFLVGLLEGLEIEMAVLEHMRILFEECWHTVWICHVEFVVLDLVVRLGCE